jgi:hypothetical protein
MTCSDLWAIQQRKYKNGKNDVSLVARPAMKSLHIGIGRYLCKVYNYHDSRACGYKGSMILPRIEGMVWLGMGWDGFGLVFVEAL